MDREDLTDEERKAVAALKRLAKRWPKTFWIFVGSGDIHVLRKQPDGSRATLPGGGMDPEMIVATIRALPSLPELRQAEGRRSTQARHLR
jgi:hypothetical protein